ncbi:YiiX/YebB-like N1pC/P60 family cysteine hydrolase [Rhodovulum adriaticum]|uniref:YiiX/YebB-like N1pC/P60 family cysteine hydrolase n=1 Tax=Rhodovulum adriaticum TaxID=35804 RepID=UPI0010444DF0|nr:YiiX/YebB-like N1pC/P60 family cysteine hydrolase [Rhodovulum adriaticum]MBK1636930.1 hypothetical protein [Rhodovulum adriaticum]
MRGRWRPYRIAGLACALTAALAGCTPLLPGGDTPDGTPAEILAGCCDRIGAYPDWMIRLADANAEPLRRLGLIQLRPGWMSGQPAARTLLEDALRPMDVLFFHSDNRVSGLLIPGQFTHGAVYIGTEAQLRAAGLWHLPALAPWRDSIAAGNTYLESVDGGVRLIGGDVVLDTDTVVALRPRGVDRAAVLRRGLARMGVPFDMRFDAGDPSALFCAELIALMFPAADLPRTPVVTRETILIDGIVAGALSGDLPFDLIGYVEATPGGGARALSRHDLARTIAAQWARRPTQR